MVRVRDAVDAGLRASYFLACGKSSSGGVDLVLLKHGRMTDLHMVHSMDVPSLFLTMNMSARPSN